MTVRVSWDGPVVKARAKAGAARGLRRAAEFVLGESRAIVPIEEGTLARSGAVDVDPVGLRATVSYDTPYAARQHEELTWRHDPGRQAKYLEQPLLTTRDKQNAIIAASIGEELQ